MPLRWTVYCLAIALFCTRAWAQDDPELGITAPQTASKARRRPKGPARVTRSPSSGSAEADAQVGGEEPAPAPSMSEWEAPPAIRDNEQPGGKEDEKRGDTDHEAIVGHFGVGLLGLAELPIAVGDPIGATSGTRTITSTSLIAPVLGTRYWLSPRAGLEGGLGFGVRTGSVKSGGDGAVDAGKVTGFAGHLGIPVAILWGQHYTLAVIPYLGIGYVKSEDSRGTSPTSDDVFGSAVLIEGGVKAAVEIQLGKIALEGLALQLSMGLRARYSSRTANVPQINEMTGVATGIDVRTTNLTVETSPGSALGSAVAGTLAALYYF